jgi:HAD superfamily hydrolase (TIGR01490 family)
MKKKPVAIFDIDGTIFRNSLLIELHWKMVKEGLIPRTAIKELDRRYWNWVTRKGSYDDYLQEVIDSFNRFINGVPTKTIQQYARQVVKVQSSIAYRYTRALVTKLQKTHLLVAVSGSPQIVVGEFARAWGFDYYIGTQHAVHNGKFTSGKIWVASENKQEALRRLQEQHGFTVGRGSVGVGDTESDIKILELVDVPICLNPTAGLYKLATRRGWLTVVERKDVIYKIRKGKIV